MMITMHSVLCHRYKIRAQIGNISFLVTAIILNVTVFVDLRQIPIFKIDEGKIRFILSLAAFVVFLLSVIFLFIDWSKKGERHEQASNQLSRLLSELRLILKVEDASILSIKGDHFNQLYDQTFETIPKIPNNKFNRLKARHYQKVELSKFIEIHPGKPFFVIWILFFCNKTFTSHEHK